MQTNITKLSELHGVLKEFVNFNNKRLIKKVPAAKVKEMYPQGNDNDAFGNNQLLGQDQKVGNGGGGGGGYEDDYTVTEDESILTKSEDKIYTESVVSLDIEN